MEILTNAFLERENRKKNIDLFFSLLYDDKINESIDLDADFEEVIEELHDELSFYESNEEYRIEDEHYFGEEKAEEILEEGIKKLKKLMIASSLKKNNW